MNRIFKRFSTVQKVVNCVRKPDFQPTRPDMAVTPSQMLSMAERGIPVAQQNAELFFDGHDNPSWFIPAEQCRGVDVADLWEANRVISGKLRKAHEQDVQQFGSE